MFVKVGVKSEGLKKSGERIENKLLVRDLCKQ